MEANIDFKAACRDIFTGESKWNDFLLLCVCVLIPVVGPVVVYGFIIRRYARDRTGASREAFDFSRFTDYLKIGLMPFLINLVLSVGAGLVMGGVYLILMLLLVGGTMFQSQGGSSNDAWMNLFPVVVAGVTMVGAAVVVMVLFVIGLPMQLAGGLTKDFGQGFSLKFLRSFLSKAGGSLFLWLMLLGMLCVPLILLGYLTLLIGFVLVQLWVVVVAWHLTFQHYDLYLSRGGTPLMIHPEVVADFPCALSFPLPSSPPPPLPPSSSDVSGRPQ